MQATYATPTKSQSNQIPGEEGVFIFVLIDMMVFAVLFASYAFERKKNIELFNQSQELLSVGIGTVNTLILLTSSWFIVLSIRALQRQRRRAALVFLALTLFTGFMFIVSKGFEYQDKFAAGVSMLTNDYYMFYFMMTGLHLVHVCIGMIALGILFTKIKNGTAGEHALESGATYWHMVDLLWIFIFPLLYVFR